MDIALFSMQKWILFILVLARTAGIFTLTPIFGAEQSPKIVRLLVAVALTLVFLPLVSLVGTLPSDVLSLGALIIREACIGLVIGFVCNLVFQAIQMAGQFVDFQAGFAFASMLDPSSGAEAAIASRFHQMVAGLLFFATNAHHVLISGVADSFSIAPVGQLGINAQVGAGMLGVFSSLFVVALRIAVPIIAAVFLADVGMALTSRLVPQMNILIVGFPVKLGVGLASMIIAMPVIIVMSRGLFEDLYGQIRAILQIVTM